MPGFVNVAIDFIPTPAVIAQFFFVAASRLENMRAPLQEAVEIFISEIDLNFEVEGRPPWPPWAPATVAKKIRAHTDKEDRVEAMLGTKEFVANWKKMIIQGKGLKILHESGELRKQATDPGNWAIEVTSAGGDAYLYKGIPNYGVAHLTGGPNLPQRFWANISFRAMDEIEDIFEDFLTKAFE